MTTLKLCPKCKQGVNRGEVHVEGCAYCSSLMEGDIDYIPLLAKGFEALPDYVDPDIIEGPYFTEMNMFNRERK